jgi:branched-chain amino acid transport system permease protein
MSIFVSTTASTKPSLATRSRSERHMLILYAVLLVAALFAPLLVYPVFLMKILCFSLFGSAAFLATGGYTTGYFLTSYSTLTPEIAIVAGTLVATALGLVFGLLAIRRQGIYFAMITLALAQLVFFFFVQAPFTHGENGLHGIPRGELLGLIDLQDNMNMYYFVLAVFIAGFALVQRMIHSPYGQVLKAIKENEARAISLGYHVDRYKLLAFVVASGLAGLAGSVKVLVFQLASLNDAHWQMSGEVILITLLGGVGTLFGPVVGATFVVSLEHELSQGALGDWVNVILGGIFIVCVLAFRAGIVGELQKWLKKKRQ